MQKAKRKAPRKHATKKRPVRREGFDCNQSAFAVLQLAIKHAG